MLKYLKIALTHLALLVALWGSATVAQDNILPGLYSVVGVASDDVLNVREGPGIGFAIIDTLAPNATPLTPVSLLVNAAMVGSTSIVPINSLHSVPAGIRPGPHITQGTRWPPSNVVPLPSRSGPADPP